MLIVGNFVAPNDDFDTVSTSNSDIPEDKMKWSPYNADNFNFLFISILVVVIYIILFFVFYHLLYMTSIEPPVEV